MPRLMGLGKKSSRINFRLDEELNQILQETEDKSKFIRKAIVHYWEHLGNRDIMPTKFIPSEETIETFKPENVSNCTWPPPWLSR